MVKNDVNSLNPDFDLKEDEHIDNVPKKEPEFTDEEISALKEKAHKCRVSMWWTADETIQSFLDYVNDGENCYCELNWKKVYSIDLINMSKKQGCDLEEAFYLVCYWKTKIEQEKERARYEQEIELERKQKEMEAIEKIPWWIEEGKKYIDESKWETWENYVNSSAKDMYFWMDIDDTLKLLKMIEEWKSRIEVQKTLDKNCGEGFYYSVVRNRVIIFSKKWEEASKILKEPS